MTPCPTYPCPCACHTPEVIRRTSAHEAALLTRIDDLHDQRFAEARKCDVLSAEVDRLAKWGAAEQAAHLAWKASAHIAHAELAKVGA